MRALPATVGSWVGAVDDLATDPKRSEIFGSGGPRVVPFQILYPASGPGDPARYVPDAQPLVTALASRQGSMARLALMQLGGLAAPWSKNSPPVQGEPFPVILYLPGVTGYMQMGSFQTTALVGQGYVVVTLNQPGVVAALLMPDGSTIEGLSRDQAYRLIAPSYEPSGTPLPAPFATALAPQTSIVPYFAADIGPVLDRLSMINTDPAHPLRGLLDLTRVGVMGMSLGAINAAQACATEARIDACLMMDAPVPLTVATTGLRQQALWISRPAADQRAERAASGGWPEAEIAAQARSIDQAVSHSDHAELLLVHGFFHVDFTDLPAIQPVFAWAGQSGPLGIAQAHLRINDLTATFFAKALGKAGQ